MCVHGVLVCSRVFLCVSVQGCGVSVCVRGVVCVDVQACFILIFCAETNCGIVASQPFMSEEYPARGVRFAWLSCGSQPLVSTLVHDPGVYTLFVVECGDAEIPKVSHYTMTPSGNVSKHFDFCVFDIVLRTIPYSGRGRHHFVESLDTVGWTKHVYAILLALTVPNAQRSTQLQLFWS